MTLLLGAILCVQARAQFDYYPLGNNQAVITGYEGTNTVVIVPNSIAGMQVTEIGSSAFFDRLDIVSVVIPEGITAIGQLGPAGSGAFTDCDSLTNVSLPSSLRIIGSLTFEECRSLTHLVIPDGVTGIGGGAFDGSGITSLTLPDSVTTLQNAFQYCYGLTNVVLSTNLTNLVSDTFYECPLLSKIIIPARVTELDSEAISYCTNLAGIYFEGNSPAISSNSFSEIATNAIAYYLPGTSGWDNFTNLPASPWWEAAFTWNANTGNVTITGLIPPCDSVDTVKIPAQINGITVTTIGAGAFSGHSHLTNALLPATITSLASGAFEDCSNLADISFLGNAPAVGPLVLADDTNATVYYLPCASGWVASFAGLPTAVGPQLLFDYTTNAGAIIITRYSQSCDVVDIPSSLNGLPVVEVGPYAFQDRAYLHSITIPNSVTNIGPGAFQGCMNLTNVLLPANLQSIADYTFESCEYLTNLSIPAGVSSIGTNAFAGCYYLQNITLPAGLTNIGPYAFSGCASLTGLPFPGALASIGEHAFDGCGSLTSITIRTNTTNIGTAAFANCIGLSAIGVISSNPRYSSVNGVLFNKSHTILMQCPAGATGDYSVPASVTNIDDYAFYECRTLLNVTVPEGVQRIGTWAFDSCFGLTNLSLPNTVLDIGDVAFRNCISLTAITVDPGNPAYRSVDGVLFDKGITTLIQYPAGKAGSYRVPDSVMTIDDWAFADSFGLNRVTVGKNVSYVGDEAFYGCALSHAFFLVFQGDAPVAGADPFGGDGSLYIYYLPNTQGWGLGFAGWTAMLWNVTLQPAASNFGVETNGFSFNIVGTSNLTVVVEACTNPADPAWIPLSTNALLNGSAPFSDPDTKSFGSRFYRVRAP